MKKVCVVVGVLILALLLAPCVSAEGITILSGHADKNDPAPDNFVPDAGRLTMTVHMDDDPEFVDNGALLITNNFDYTVCTATRGHDAWGEWSGEPDGVEVILPGDSVVEIFGPPDDSYWWMWGPGVYDFDDEGSLVYVHSGKWVEGGEEKGWHCAWNGDDYDIWIPTRIVILSSGNSIPSPEFPSATLPVTMIIGFLGAVLLIQRTREQ